MERKEEIWYWMIIIIITIIYILYNIEKSKINKDIKENSLLEIIWTIIPTIIIIGLGIPSLIILNKIEEINNTLMTIEIKGNQWYWTYNYKDFNIKYDSYSILEPSLGELRLLSVDKPLYIPNNIPIRLLITSEDVIHSFTIPHLGIKLDSNPGKINTININVLDTGSFFGQCSELCRYITWKNEYRNEKYKKEKIYILNNK